MKLRSGKVIHPIGIQEKYEKFNQDYGITLKETYEKNKNNCDTTMNELLILRVIRYLTYNKSNVYRFIERYDDIINFIELVNNISTTIYNDLILEFWSLQNYDVGDLSRFEWTMSIIQHNHCKNAINVIEKFKDELYPKFKEYYNKMKTEKESILQNINYSICDNLTNEIIKYMY
tara:strand:- start:86 stop:610 length:525 start_codon:yes stop_codon:yes gene_type:complete